MTPRIVLVGVLALAVFGCDEKVASFHVTTASIDGIELGRGYEGNRAVGVGTSFAPGDTALHAVIGVSAVPPDTKITGSWIAVDAAGVKDQLIDRSEFTAAAGTTQVHFTLSNDRPWPTGRYRFDVQIGEQGVQSREFAVADPAGASASVALAAPAAGLPTPTAAASPVAAASPIAAALPVPTTTHADAPSHAAHVGAPPANVGAPAAAAEADDDEAIGEPAAAPSAADEADAAEPAPAAGGGAKSYPASVAGICSKMVDCGCEQSVSTCSQTLSGLTKLPKSVKRCVLSYECSGLCGSSAQKCVTDHYAQEAEITRQIGEMSRKQREYWPTGDDKTCPAGYRRSGNTCYAQ